jgi:hypothetical protein
MYRMFVALPLIAISLSLNSSCFAQPDPDNALKVIGDFMVGTWVPPGEKDPDRPRLHSWGWTLEKKFVQINGERDLLPWHGYLGVDLAKRQLGWWAFFADGTCGVIYLTKFSESEWVFEGNAVTPQGKLQRKVTFHPLADRLHVKIEGIQNGETTVIEEIWQRDR